MIWIFLQYVEYFKEGKNENFDGKNIYFLLKGGGLCEKPVKKYFSFNLP